MAHDDPTSLWWRLRPAVTRRGLIFIAAAVWSIAAWRVLTTGSRLLEDPSVDRWAGLLEGLAGFPVFFWLVFLRVARRHSRRIALMPRERACAFSFFDARSYVVMAFMIALGVSMRVFHLLPPAFLGPFYLSLGLSLLGAAIVFAQGGLRWQDLRRRSEPR